MAVEINGYELNEPGESSDWSQREFNLLSAFAELLPYNGTNLVDSEHRHTKLYDGEDVSLICYGDITFLDDAYTQKNIKIASNDNSGNLQILRSDNANPGLFLTMKNYDTIVLEEPYLIDKIRPAIAFNAYLDSDYIWKSSYNGTNLLLIPHEASNSFIFVGTSGVEPGDPIFEGFVEYENDKIFMSFFYKAGIFNERLVSFDSNVSIGERFIGAIKYLVVGTNLIDMGSNEYKLDLSATTGVVYVIDENTNLSASSTIYFDKGVEGQYIEVLNNFYSETITITTPSQQGGYEIQAYKSLRAYRMIDGYWWPIDAI